MKYTDDATLVWSIAWNGELNDKPTDIAIDNAGGIIVAGQSEASGTISYITVKYEEVEAIIPPDEALCPNSFSFYPNREQIIDDNNTVRTDIKYYTTNHYPALYFSSPVEEENYRMVSYVFRHIDEDTTTTDTLQRVDMTFQFGWASEEAPSLDTKPVSTDKSSTGYLNYFLPQCNHGITHLEGFSKLYYPSVFDNTDVLFYGNDAGMKFYIILKPGTEPDINLKFTGQDDLVITSSSLEIVTSIGSYTYNSPDVFQIDANGDRQEVSFTPEYSDWGNGRVGFTLGTYDSALPLIIEVEQEQSSPAVASTSDWSTWLGGSLYDEGRDVITDASGSAFFCGATSSPNFPDLTGGFQTSIVGLRDAFIKKFDFNGAPVWGTLYGGSLDDRANAMAINSQGKIYIVGYTRSNDITMVPSTSQNLQGVDDGFIACISSGGSSLLFSRCFGGNNSSQGEDARSIAIDASDNIYIVGKTTSSSGNNFIFNRSGAYNQSSVYGGVFTDAFIAEFNSSNTQTWGSFFGGDGDDDFACVIINPSNNHVLCSGSTRSTTAASTNTANTLCGVPNSPTYFPDCDPGSNGYHKLWLTTALLGSSDAIIVEFDQNGALKWSTYFGGDGVEHSYDVDALQNNALYLDPVNTNVMYLVGNTALYDHFPTTDPGGAYIQPQPSFSGSNAWVYIAKFVNRELNWATLFGDRLSVGMDVAVDQYENLYIIGNTRTGTYATNSCVPPPAADLGNSFPKCQLSGAYFQTSFGGGVQGDGIIAAFNKYNHILWSTYYGGNITDYPYACAYDNINHRLYLTGKTRSGVFPPLDPPTNNYQQPAFGGSSLAPDFWDAFIARFDVMPVIVIGTDEIMNQTSQLINIYPNPSASDLFIELNSIEKGDLKIFIFDVTGRVLLEQNENMNLQQERYALDISNLPKGIYFLQLQSAKITYNAKIIKQ